MLSILLRCGFVIIASVGASVGLIFQKKAHANPPVLMNLEWWTGIIIATLASITDSVALIFIRTSTIAVLACISIPINVIVSGRLLKGNHNNKAEDVSHRSHRRHSRCYTCGTAQHSISQ